MYSISCYPQFSITTVGLQTYYQWIRQSTQICQLCKDIICMLYVNVCIKSSANLLIVCVCVFFYVYFEVDAINAFNFYCFI